MRLLRQLFSSHSLLSGAKWHCRNFLHRQVNPSPWLPIKGNIAIMIRITILVWRLFMKLFGTIVLLFLVQACDPYGFGFKQNPANVLNQAFKSVLTIDPERFLEISGKEALCIYGNNEGMTYLNSNLNLNPDNIEIKPKLIENLSRYTKSPQFVGYWSYYNEKYEVDILDKTTNSDLLKVIVECHYGFEGQKKEAYQNLKLKKYKKKECKVIKLTTFHFEGLPMRAECAPLSVEL